MNWPKRTRRFLSGSVGHSVVWLLRKNTGKPLTCMWRRSLQSERSLVINPKEIGPTKHPEHHYKPVPKILPVKDQRERSSETLSVQWREAWTINIVRAIYMMFWIACSACAFWCWAPALEKDWLCHSLRSHRNISSEKYHYHHDSALLCRLIGRKATVWN